MNPTNPTVGDQQEQLLANAPIPTLWLIGKTGSGKTSIIRYLTGATNAEIGSGFRPQTKHSKLYDFPDNIAPIARFLDTRGLGESDYDPSEDLEKFNDQADLVLVVVRAMDQAIDEIIRPLRDLRKSGARQSKGSRPAILVLTCLHEGYPGKQHSDSGLFEHLDKLPLEVPVSLRRSIAAQIQRFDGLVDRVVAIDLTPPDEGFEQPEYCGQKLKSVVLDSLPAAYRQTLIQIDELNKMFAEAHQKRIAPVILGHSTLAATAAAVPFPWADIPLVLGIQSRMAYTIAKMNNQTLDRKKIAHVTAAMGGRIAIRMGIREGLKFIPWIGIAANIAATFAFTFAAGWSWNWYFMQLNAGHMPTTEELRSVYQKQLKRGENFWKATKEKSSH